MECFGSLITPKGQESTKEVCNYRVHLEDQRVRSIELRLAAYSKEASAPGGSCGGFW